MPNKDFSGAGIRQTFIDFFSEMGHTFVPSSSVVPGDDATLLFTNAGMVQCKDVFLGTDKRPYTRAVNSQKCMRVAGKHNDLDDVGRDDTHHTFFEMLGNWSFGDYYKKEAIAWAWTLLTDVWELPKERIWATCFEDDKGDIPRDDEAANYWRQQPGFVREHVLFFGRKDNFWEMADTGPCGPNSEIHYDQGADACDKQGVPGHICQVNGDCTRYLEIWNLVFMQYNRLGPDRLEPLPAKHVDTGAGLERIVAILQGKRSNYKTDLLFPLIQTTQTLTGHSDEQREANITPYRVIADHARTAAFLIGDGVIPGNTGRNYICRMIIRRAARFGGKIGQHEPFLAKVADTAIQNYGDFYSELKQNRSMILEQITREEERFQRTVESGMARLEQLFERMRQNEQHTLSGEQAFDLYATYGLPLEITKDIAQEQGLSVDEAGFRLAMDEHRLTSGGGAFGVMGGDDIDIYRQLAEELQSSGKLAPEGVRYDPYQRLETEGEILALVSGGQVVSAARTGAQVQVVLPETGFYIESGGQVSDTGTLVSVKEPRWEIRVTEMRKPAAGVIVHVGEVVRGEPKVGDVAIAAVDAARRQDIMRNHTATHLLHAALHDVLGGHARQAGSLVAPDRLRFDFTHPEAVTRQQLDEIEQIVNHNILGNYSLAIKLKPLAQAKSEGAMALFGEKYADIVRTITIGAPEPFSYELCGGTHVDETGNIGLFLITAESSIAAGIRRIEAVTGRQAYKLVQHSFQTLRQSADRLNTTAERLAERIAALQDETAAQRKELDELRLKLVASEFLQKLGSPLLVQDVRVLTAMLPGADANALRQMCDRFRQQYPTLGLTVLASVQDGSPVLIASLTDDLVKRGLKAGDLVNYVAIALGGKGGGRPNLAQAGGGDPARLDQALDSVVDWVRANLG